MTNWDLTGRYDPPLVVEWPPPSEDNAAAHGETAEDDGTPGAAEPAED